MTVEELVAALNAYTGDNPWQDVILPSSLCSEAATEQVDPSAASDVVVTVSGRVVRWDPAAGLWFDAGSYESETSDDAARWRP